MWQRLSLPWQACLELAWAAFCDDCYPIGAVVTGPDGAILSQGRNRVYPKRRWRKDLRGNDIAHAEVEALREMKEDAVDRHSCILFSTMEPCPMCMGTFYMSGLRTLHYAARDPYAGSVDLLGKTPYLSRKSIQVQGPLPELEILLIGLYMEQEFQHHSGILPTSLFFESYSHVLPAGMEFARKLYQTGQLQSLKENGATAELAFATLSAMIEPV